MNDVFEFLPISAVVGGQNLSTIFIHLPNFLRKMRGDIYNHLVYGYISELSIFASKIACITYLATIYIGYIQRLYLLIRLPGWFLQEKSSASTGASAIPSTYWMTCGEFPNPSRLGHGMENHSPEFSLENMAEIC